MGYEEHFRKLGDLTQKREEELRREREKKVAERQRLATIYLPKIKKVCESFAKAVGWQYQEDKGDISDIHIMSCAVNNDRPYEKTRDKTKWLTFEVALREDLIVVYNWKCPNGSTRRNWANYDGLIVSFDEFTEDKLAQIFEKWYRRILIVK